MTSPIVSAPHAEPLMIRGGQARSFPCVDEGWDGIVSLMEVPSSLALNLGDPEEYTIMELQTIEGLRSVKDRAALERVRQ